MFDADYYERGLLTGKSCYENYRWIPDLTIPMAMTIVDYLKIKRWQSVLDYGCAKGFLVKALRWLSRDAWGYDVSQYAVSHADPEVKTFVSNVLPFHRFDFCVAKDVFEHIPDDALAKIVERDLSGIPLFVVVPLGEEGSYRAKSNNLDITHVICEPEEWWTRFFTRCNRQILKTDFRVQGIKDHYQDVPKSHGFFTLV